MTEYEEQDIKEAICQGILAHRGIEYAQVGRAFIVKEDAGLDVGEFERLCACILLRIQNKWAPPPVSVWIGSKEQLEELAEFKKNRIILKPQALREAVQWAVLENRGTKNWSPMEKMKLVEEIMDTAVIQDLKEN